MRTLLCGVVAALLAFFQNDPQRPPAGTVSLTGRVVTGSGPEARPVRRARVTLAGQALTAPRFADTDTKGAYRFDRLPAGVQVVLTPKVSRIGGGVSDDKGSISDYAVVIFASDPTKWIDRSRFVVMARPSQQGRFEVRGLPPEDYLAVALPNVVGNEYMDPEFLQQLRRLATPFTIMEGDSKTLELTLKKRP